MDILKRLENNKRFWFVIFAGFLFFILRFPSLFEPLWYGDEGIYQVVGTSLNHGKLLYSQIFDNKPPFLYWLYAIFQSDQFTVRFASLLFGITAIIMFFFLSRKIFGKVKSNKNIPLLTTFLFAFLFGLPLLEGNIANAENFMLLPILTAALLLIANLNINKSANKSTPISPFVFLTSHFFIAGLLLGIAFLFKIVAIFDLGAFLAFYFILNFNLLKKKIGGLLEIISGFLLPIFLVTLFFISNGTAIDFAKATLISNIFYVDYNNKIGAFPILLFIKLILLGTFLLYVFVKRKKISKSLLFVLIWFAFSLFNAYFSQRPYPHYLLVLIASFSLMIGVILFDRKNQKIIAIFLIVALLAITKTFAIPNLNKSIRYYQNFISYVKGEKTMTQYQAFFDPNTPLDYVIARFIKPKLGVHDTIFVWGNNAQLYQLVGVIAPTKYVVAYHILNYKDGSATTRATIDIAKPKFIVTMSNSGPLPFPLINYSNRININNSIVYERVF